MYTHIKIAQSMLSDCQVSHRYTYPTTVPKWSTELEYLGFFYSKYILVSFFCTNTMIQKKQGTYVSIHFCPQLCLRLRDRRGIRSKKIV